MLFHNATKVGPSAASAANHHEGLLDRLWTALRPGIVRGGGGGGGDERAIMQSFVTPEWGEVSQLVTVERGGESVCSAASLLSFFVLVLLFFFMKLKYITNHQARGTG